MRKRLLNAAFAAYKHALGPMLRAGYPGACPYQPTCSEYATLACAEHGFLRGGAMAVWRIARCNPFSRGGWDPVPARRPVRLP